MTTKEDKIRHLPIWARTYIKELEDELEVVNKTLGSADDDTTDTYFVNWDNCSNIHLPNGSVLGFRPDTKDDNWVEARIDSKTGRLQLASQKPMVIRANASNNIIISFD